MSFILYLIIVSIRQVYYETIGYLILIISSFFFGNISNRPEPASEKPYAKAPEGEGCPRCGGFVYAAEQMLARGKVTLPI